VTEPCERCGIDLSKAEVAHLKAQRDNAINAFYRQAPIVEAARRWVGRKPDDDFATKVELIRVVLRFEAAMYLTSKDMPPIELWPVAAAYIEEREALVAAYLEEMEALTQEVLVSASGEGPGVHESVANALTRVHVAFERAFKDPVTGEMKRTLRPSSRVKP
jgi:hypothetical protein